MRLIIAGCEYSGTTTLSQTFGDWGAANMEGGRWGPNEYHAPRSPHSSLRRLMRQTLLQAY